MTLSIYFPAFHVVNTVSHIILINKEIGSWCVLPPEEYGLIQHLRGSYLSYDSSRDKGISMELIQKLFKSGIITINGIDYFTDNKEKRSTSPFSIIVKTTNQCNLRCTYCYTQFAKIAPASISPKKIVTVVDRIHDLIDPERVLVIVFHGGEPLYRFNEIKEVISLLNSKYTNIEYSVQTNGVLLNNETISFLKKNNIRVGVSIDGHTFDNNRTRFSRLSQFNQVINNIEHLAHSGVRFGILSVLNNQNATTIVESIQRFYEIGVRNFVLNPLLSKDSMNNHTLYSTLADTYLSLIKYINDWNESQVNEADYINERSCSGIINTLKLYQHEQCYSIPCGAGSNSIACDSDGKLYLCDLFLGDPKFEICDLDTISQIIDAEVIKGFIDFISKDRKDECLSCLYDKLCPFRCPADSYYIYQDFNHRHSLCELSHLLLPPLMEWLSSNRIRVSNFKAM